MSFTCEQCKRHAPDHYTVEEPGWGGAFFFCSIHCLAIWASLQTALQSRGS